MPARFLQSFTAPNEASMPCEIPEAEALSKISPVLLVK
jgi:hypothetical protein